MTEFTLNIKLPPLALKLRKCRLKKGYDYKSLSVACGISVSKLIEFEYGKKIPSEEEKQILFDFLK